MTEHPGGSGAELAGIAPPRRTPFWRYVVIAFLAAVFLAGTAVANPNIFKPWLSQWVKREKQRTLVLEGDIRLGLIPALSLEFNGIRLGGRNSPAEFASVQRARFDLAWLPLLRREPAFGEIALRGVRASLVRYPDGSTNFDDLLPKQPSRPVRFDVGRFTIHDGALGFDDRRVGYAVALSRLEVASGRFRNKLPAPVELGFSVQGAGGEAHMRMRGTVAFDPENKRLVLHWQEWDMAGAMAGVSGLEARLNGETIEVSPDGLAAGDISLAARGVRDGLPLAARLAIPRLQGGSEDMLFENLALEVEAGQPGRRIKSRLSGDARLRREGRAARLDFAGHLDGSPARLTAVPGKTAGYRFAIDIDRLDLDRYLSAGGASSFAAGKPPDLSALDRLGVSGSLHVGQLKAGSTVSRDFRLDVGGG